ncbi:HAD family hydrolase [Actinomarinicola tropica]|uniref:HAD-IB family hydrolase n=1 Tax=Actinomarinicola tropica TaxID=2789776 RepID=A0A5Q2RQ08_9ACTN|nr:HAD-IB family hydrolase [Actinomarinicola tropica]QGG96526.1 HAD-IB family hydrolase [Actinomarinicola tropica]
MEAAFFDLDKTVIARAALVAFSRPLHQAGYLSRWLVLRALYGHFVFQYLGADDERMARMRESALRVTKGWHQPTIKALVEETLDEVIEPIVYAEALELIRRHKEEGRRVYLVSASPEEVVVPLARHLGVDQAIATTCRLDEDLRYTGEVDLYAFGPFKAEAIRSEADVHGIDLDASYAYSDSATDLPMLRAVGHPVAVNPDRDLLKAARAEGWEVQVFDRPVSMRSRRPASPRTAAGIGGGAVALGAVAALALWWIGTRRTPPPTRWGRWRPGRGSAGWRSVRRSSASSTPRRRGR